MIISSSFNTGTSNCVNPVSMEQFSPDLPHTDPYYPLGNNTSQKRNLDDTFRSHTKNKSIKKCSVDNEKKVLDCPQCKYTTDRKNNLKRHIVTMHQNCSKTLECCGVMFESKSSLREHVLLFHSSGYQCQVCGRNFCRKALLRRHLSVHSGQKDHKCSHCSYATSHKSNLERHQKVHGKHLNTEKPDEYSPTEIFFSNSLRSQPCFSEQKRANRKSKPKLKKSPTKVNSCIDKGDRMRVDEKSLHNNSLDERNGNRNKLSDKSYSFSGNSVTFCNETSRENCCKDLHSVTALTQLSDEVRNNSPERCSILSMFVDKNHKADSNVVKPSLESFSNDSYVTQFCLHKEARSETPCITDKVPLAGADILGNSFLKTVDAELPELCSSPPENEAMGLNKSESITDNISYRLHVRLCVSPYKCQVCLNTFSSQVNFLNHNCGDNKCELLLPITCMMMKKDMKN